MENHTSSLSLDQIQVFIRELTFTLGLALMQPDLHSKCLQRSLRFNFPTAAQKKLKNPCRDEILFQADTARGVLTFKGERFWIEPKRTGLSSGSVQSLWLNSSRDLKHLQGCCPNITIFSSREGYATGKSKFSHKSNKIPTEEQNTHQQRFQLPNHRSQNTKTPPYKWPNHKIECIQLNAVLSLWGLIVHFQ